MRKTVLFLLLLSVTAYLGISLNSCSKKDNQIRLAYSVDSIKDNVYVGDTGITYWPVKFSFLSGNPQEQMTITINGLPQRLTVTPNAFTATPTFTENFKFVGGYAPIGSYPANMVVYSPSTGSKTYNFNLVVVAANCAMNLAGTYSGSNACTSAGYNFSSNVTATGGYTLNIENLGGYGSNSNVIVNVNCGTDSLTIAKQADGNGDTLQGKGIFTANQMILYYKKTTTVGTTDSCVATLNRN